jgi:Transposase DNA-binding
MEHDGAADAWFDRELANSRFVDERLGKRLRQLVQRMESAMGASIPLACQDWANTKAAYRFFSNDRVSEEEILTGHFQATRSRFAATIGPILVLQDTTEFTFQRERAEGIGITYRVNSGKDKSGRFRMHTVCGLLMHSSLAVTLDGLPLGLSAIKFWTRTNFKGTAALKSLTQKELSDLSRLWLVVVASYDEVTRCPGPRSHGRSIGALGCGIQVT